MDIKNLSYEEKVIRYIDICKACGLDVRRRQMEYVLVADYSLLYEGIRQSGVTTAVILKLLFYANVPSINKLEQMDEIELMSLFKEDPFNETQDVFHYRQLLFMFARLCSEKGIEICEQVDDSVVRKTEPIPLFNMLPTISEMSNGVHIVNFFIATTGNSREEAIENWNETVRMITNGSTN